MKHIFTALTFLFLCGLVTADNNVTGELARELNMNAKDYILWKSTLRNLDRAGQQLSREDMKKLYQQIASRPDYEPLVRAVPLSCSPNYEYATPFKDFAKTQTDLIKAWPDNFTWAPSYAPTYAPSSYSSPYMNYSPSPSFSSIPETTGGFGGGFNLTLNNKNLNSNKNASLNKNGNSNLNKNGRK